MDENPGCEACGGINCNCVIMWSQKLKMWFPVQQTELWFNRLKETDSARDR